MTLTLLSRRSATATVCPSEVARAMSPDGNWREMMPAVHAAVDDLVRDGVVELSWRRRALEERIGPYRIRKVAK